LKWKCKKLFTDPDNGIAGILFVLFPEFVTGIGKPIAVGNETISVCPLRKIKRQFRL
jgi:hypothetical protein